MLVRCSGALCFAAHASSLASRGLYNHHNLTKYRKAGRDSKGSYTLGYGKSSQKDQHLLRELTTPTGMQQEFSYDGYGNQLTAKTKKKKNKS